VLRAALPDLHPRQSARLRGRGRQRRPTLLRLAPPGIQTSAWSGAQRPAEAEIPGVRAMGQFTAPALAIRAWRRDGYPVNFRG
jgi:hypothetical protein